MPNTDGWLSRRPCPKHDRDRVQDHRMKRTWFLLGFLTALLAVVGAGHALMPFAVGWLITSGLEKKGYSDARLTVAEIGLTHMRITDVDLGQGLGVTVDGIELQFSPGRLVDGVVDGVTLNRPSLAFGLSAKGLDLGALSSLVETSDKTDAMSWRLQGPLKLISADLLIQTPFGEVGAAATGEALVTDSIGSTVDVDIALAHPDAELRGTIRGVIGPDGEGRGEIEIDRATSRATLAFTRLSGNLSVSGRFPDRVTGAASLTLRDAAVQGTEIGDMDFTGSIDGTAASASFLMAGNKTGVTIDIEARSADILDATSPLMISGNIATDGLRGPLATRSGLDALGAVDFTLQGAREDLQAFADSIAAGAISAPGPISGWLEASQFNVRTATAEAQIDGLGALRIGPTGWQFRPTGDLLVDAETEVDDQRHRVAMALRAHENEAFLSGDANALAPLRANIDADVVFDDTLAFSGSIAGNLWADGSEARLENAVLRLDPLGTKVGGLDVVFEDVTGRLDGSINDPNIRIGGEVKFSGSVNPDIDVEAGRLAVAASIVFIGNDIVVEADGCQELRAASWRIRDVSIRPGPVRVCGINDGLGLVRLVRDADGVKTVEVSASVRAAEIAVESANGFLAAGTTPRVEGRLGLDLRRGTWWTATDISGGAVTLDSYGVSASGVHASIAAEGAASLIGIRANLDDLRVTDANRPRRLPPVNFSGKGEVANGTWRWDGDVAIVDGPTVQVTARHRPNQDRGRLSASLAEWRITDATPDISQLFPDLNGRVARVRGAIAGEARLDWAPRGTSSSGRVMLTDLAMAMPNIELEGIFAEISFADLLDLRTNGPQSVAIGRLDAGIPLFGGEVTVNLPGQGRVEVPVATWPLAGGRLAIRDIVLTPDDPLSFIDASLDGLDGGTLAALLDIEGFEADGTLSGQIPLRLTTDGPVIDNAQLRAVREGHLRFRSPAAIEALKGQGGSAELLAEALEDFRYTELELTVDGPLSGEISARAKIKGANPALYEGKRIDLNVNLTGDLRELLQSASVISDIPAAVRDRIGPPAGIQ